MKNSSLVSIITTVFNNKNTVESAIKSVLSQDYPNIEYIITDGGSTDGTIEIINKYEDKIAKFVSEKDRGVYDGMNKGIKLATGDIIGILNSDDLYASNDVIGKIVSAFLSYSVDSVYGDLVYVDKNDLNKIIRVWKSGTFKYEKLKLAGCLLTRHFLSKDGFMKNMGFSIWIFPFLQIMI